ncbi:MAG: hypothetical protein NVSMB30_19640 [Hymenobacter sp.]
MADGSTPTVSRATVFMGREERIVSGVWALPDKGSNKIPKQTQSSERSIESE